VKLRLDWQFGAALLVAPIVWIILLFILPTTFDFLWPLYSLNHFLMLVISYPILEEIAFRGCLQSILFSDAFGRKKLAGISFANVITSLIFTGFHFFYHPILWASLVFFPSLILGYFRDKYDTIEHAIILHIFYNGGYYWIFRIG